MTDEATADSRATPERCVLRHRGFAALGSIVFRRSRTLRSTLEWLAPQATAASLPVLPRLASGRPERLVLIRPDNGIPYGERLVLRLWQSEVTLTVGPVQTPLWLGSITTERFARVAWLTTTTGEAAVSGSELRNLGAAIPMERIQHRPAVDMESNWDGSVLMGKATGLAASAGSDQPSTR